MPTINARLRLPGAPPPRSVCRCWHGQSPTKVAAALNHEFSTCFRGRPDDEIDLTITVDRARQRDAIACHRSQSIDNPVLWRRLDLLGTAEHLRYLVP